MTKSTVYTDPRVSKRALNEFFAKFQPERDEIHTLQIFHNDSMVVRIAPAPYSPTDKREIYSLSKSFCSTAIGFLCDEGKLSLDDRIVDLFPDKLPETVSENLAKMRVKHVLSMNTGHPSCVMYHMVRSDDAARAFLAQEVVYEPGEVKAVAYNADGTRAAEKIIRTAGEPAYIALAADRCRISADGDDLVYITASVVDANGNVCPLADNRLYFEVTGNGELLTTDNGDQRETESFARHDKKVLAGYCVACARSIKDQPGKLTLNVTANGIACAEIEIDVK
jgi:hypothetical protein